LNEEKAKVMKSLLESVQTPKLKATFDKYLPAVLNNGAERRVAQKQQLSESKIITEITGDKSANKSIEVEEGPDNLIDFKRLAGL
jgi:hypothetical protein